MTAWRVFAHIAMSVVLGVLTLAGARADTPVEISAGISNTLPLDLQRRLTKLGIPSDTLSLVVKKIGVQTPLVSWHPDEPRNPASVMKIVTTFAGLSALGPGYQWKTDVRRTGKIHEGKLDGDLILVGKGNPFFLKPDLWTLVNELESRGIYSISGDLIIDDTYFDLPNHDPDGFDGEGYRPYNVGPSAALFNFNTLDFYLVPREGEALVEVRTTPPIENIEIVSDIAQLAGACRGNKIRLRMNVESQSERPVVRFSGNYPERCGRYHLTRSVMSSNELLFGTLESLFKERGGALEGHLLIGASPADASSLLTITSQTLSEIIRSINKFSNNVMSRQLFLTVGAERFGAPTSMDKAQRALVDVLKQNDIQMPHLSMDNGSGLCRDCSVSANGLLHLLEVAWDSRFMPEFFSSLPVPGEDGALKKRFRSGKFKGRIHMKTGTIDHVSAAAGLVHGEGQQRYLFVMMINHKNVDKGKGQAFQRYLMNWLVSL